MTVIEPSIKRLIYKQALRNKTLSISRENSPFQFHASESGDCPRALYFRHIGRQAEENFESKDHEARVCMLLGDGAGIHQERVTDYIRDSPGVHITNIESDRMIQCQYLGIDYIITGHCDGILYFPKEKERWILEIKGLSTYSIKAFGKQRLFEEDIDSLKTVYPKAIPQSRLYRKMYHTEDKPIKGSIILIKDKNDSSLYEFHIPADEKVEDRIIQKFGRIAECIKKTTPPSCDFLKSDYVTKYCHYPKECGTGR